MGAAKFDDYSDNTGHSKGTAEIKALEHDVFYNYKETGIRTSESKRLRKQYDVLRMSDRLLELQELKKQILTLEGVSSE